jgi:arylformamidase
MQIVDLSHKINFDMPMYPGDEPPSLEKLAAIEREGYRETKITIHTHTGTHIDAPGHMLEYGPYLDCLNLEQFFGKAIILDYDDDKNQNLLINLNRIKAYQGSIEKTEFVILKTNWSQYWGENKYYKNYPYLSIEAAHWLAKFPLKGIGIDAISIDKSDSIDFPVHKILLSKNMIVIENLTNLDAVKNEFFMLSVLPLKIKNTDGSPVRAIAIEELKLR